MANKESNYILSCCSTSDLSKEFYEQRDLRYICFHFNLGGKEYVDDLGQSIPFDEFYRRMAEGEMTRTSQVNTEEFVEYFRGLLKEGKDIIHVCLSSGLSGVVNSANIAKSILESEFPERKITIIDSLGASSGYGLLMYTLADLRDEGKSYDEVVAFAQEHNLNVHHWFFSTDLTFYIRGGRVTKTAGFFGNMLHICPLLNMDNLGRLIPREKIRGKKRVIVEIVEKMKEHADKGLDYDGRCFISNSACMEDAQKVAELVEQTFPKLKGKVEIFSIGTTIGSHTGPGTVALFFFGDKRGE